MIYISTLLQPQILVPRNLVKRTTQAAGKVLHSPRRSSPPSPLALPPQSRPAPPPGALGLGLASALFCTLALGRGLASCIFTAACTAWAASCTWVHWAWLAPSAAVGGSVDQCSEERQEDIQGLHLDVCVPLLAPALLPLMHTVTLNYTADVPLLFEAALQDFKQKQEDT